MSNIRDFFKMTPEESERMRIKRFAEIKELSSEYQLGKYIGLHIVSAFLPTLSTDMIKSRKVIKVSDEETRQLEELNNRYFNESNGSDDKSNRWEELSIFHKKLARRYLPHVLECVISPLNVQNEKELKQGIMRSLWDCDMCGYKCEKLEDIIIVPFEENEYPLFTTIKLNLDV
jgi:rubrerythrin